MLGLGRAARLVGQRNADVARIAIPIERDVEVRVAIADQHVLDGGIIGVALRIPIPAVAAYVACIVEIVEQGELRREQVMIGGNRLWKLHPRRIAVALLQIAKNLIVGTVFFLDVDHMFDVVSARNAIIGIVPRIAEAVVSIHKLDR